MVLLKAQIYTISLFKQVHRYLVFIKFSYMLVDVSSLDRRDGVILVNL